MKLIISHTKLLLFLCTAAKPIMLVQLDHDPIILQQTNNIMLTCGVQYAYPIPNIKWNITTPLSATGPYIMQENFNNNSGYKLHSNGSIEVYHRFLLEKGYIIVKCSASNIHGSGKKTFNLWDHKTFTESMYCICVATYKYKYISS